MMDKHIAFPVVIFNIQKKRDIYTFMALYDTLNDMQKKDYIPKNRRDALIMASFHPLPEGIKHTLLERHDNSIDLRLAKNPTSQNLLLKRIYKRHSHDVKFLSALSSNPRTGIELIRLLAESTEISVHESLAANPQCPREILANIAMSSAEAGYFAAKNPKATPELLFKLWGNDILMQRTCILRHPDCPQTLLDSKFSNLSLTLQQARHPNTGNNHLITLSLHDNEAVRATVARHPRLSKDNLIKLLVDPCANVRRGIARQPFLDIKTQKILATDRDPWVRIWLAYHSMLDSQLLLILARDEHPKVRRAVARHPLCPSQLLTEFSKDSDSWVQAGLAWRPNLPSELIETLSKKENLDILTGLAHQKYASQELLIRLAEHQNEDVRRAVARNPYSTSKVISKLTKDPYPLNRILIVHHPNLTSPNLLDLCTDPEPRVRFMSIRAYVNKPEQCSSKEHNL
ncbi:MAG: hypothetical protein KGI54_13435 [Pseudomonadota bacterium]|nr:hypothetical protein [Pseudomonadota bacterium]